MTEGVHILLANQKKIVCGVSCSASMELPVCATYIPQLYGPESELPNTSYVASARTHTTVSLISITHFLSSSLTSSLFPSSLLQAQCKTVPLS